MIKREFVVVLFAALIYLGCILSPPTLMDDVDAVQAQIENGVLQLRISRAYNGAGLLLERSSA